MLKITDYQLTKLNNDYPDIKESILSVEQQSLPSCIHCQSSDTAEIIIGVIGRTIALAAATTKVKLHPNRKQTETHYCNTCSTYFSPLPPSYANPVNNKTRS